MQVNSINSNSYSTNFGARRIGGKFAGSYNKTHKANNAHKTEKYCKQYIQGIKNACSATKGDLQDATDSLNKLEHRFFYNTSNLESKKVKPLKKLDQM